MNTVWSGLALAVSGGMFIYIIGNYFQKLLQELKTIRENQHQFFMIQSEVYRKEHYREEGLERMSKAKVDIEYIKKDLKEARDSGDKKKISKMEEKIGAATANLESGKWLWEIGTGQNKIE